MGRGPYYSQSQTPASLAVGDDIRKGLLEIGVPEREACRLKLLRFDLLAFEKNLSHLAEEKL